MRGITKRYGSLLANDGIDLDIAQGGIHAIVGENGAGKTTLMRIIYGMVQPDAGTYEVDAQRVRFGSPAAAIERGIGMVHQRFELIDDLTALENLVLGQPPVRNGVFFDRSAALNRARALADQLHTRLDWNVPVRNLTVGTRQRLEIMRLLYRNADILIFDEPTSVLTPQEADDLFVIMRNLAAQGRTIVFITHKLREVFAVADTVTVMRRGRIVATTATADTDAHLLALQMVGEELERSVHPVSASGGDPILDVDRLTAADDLGTISVRAASFVLHRGEILGVAGVEGNGQRELVQALVGLRPLLSGSIRLRGERVDRLSVRARRRHGMVYISEDRDNEGASLAATLADNLIADEYDHPPLSRAGQLLFGVIRRFAQGILERFDVRGGGPETPARSLSGGNLQRMIVGREMHEIPKVLIASHPTRGVDVRGTAFIHDQLESAREAGAAVLLISEELSELTELCDRLLVIFEGRIVADVPVSEVTPDRLGALMTGAAA